MTSIKIYVFSVMVACTLIYIFTRTDSSLRKDIIIVEPVDFKSKYMDLLAKTLKNWKSCPKEDGSLESIMITNIVDGSGLGNQVWGYLSVWAIARRYGIRPVMPVYTISRLSKMFKTEHMNVPSLRDLGVKCNMPTWILEEYHFGAHVIGSPKGIFRKLQLPAKENRTLIRLPTYVVDGYSTLPLWNELTTDLVIRDELRKGANDRLRDIRTEYYYSLLKNHTFKNLKMRDIEFVSVHVRRTEYVNHIKTVYKSDPVDERYYKQAFNWITKQLPLKSLAFIVVTDDMKWASEYLAKGRPDVFLPGSGVYHDPYQDMALLAACNHSIFAYGTFGLTGALLAQGGYNIVYDIGNGSVTKEMQFASSLPRWYIMDREGNLKYENDIFKLSFGAS